MINENKLTFQAVTLADYDRIYPYTSEYGEGSCQHSPVSMYSLEEKYGDKIAIEDDVLYTLRSRLSDETYRVYLAPLGSGSVKEGFLRLLADAKSYGKKVKFVSLTEKFVSVLEKEFPGRFEILEDRDLAEYMYPAVSMAAFLGGKLKKRRGEVRTFWYTYGDRAVITDLTPEMFPEVLQFEYKWLEINRETHDMHTLNRDARMIEDQLKHFDELHLSGNVLWVDGTIGGFCYGTKLSDRYYDVIVEKADRDIPHSYKVLRQESAKRCAVGAGCAYVNMEEDVGVPGLRELKMHYKPEYLLRKFIVTER